MLVLNFVVNPRVLSRRFEGRRVCPVCLSVYHIDSLPPAVEVVKVELLQRSAPVGGFDEDMASRRARPLIPAGAHRRRGSIRPERRQPMAPGGAP